LKLFTIGHTKKNLERFVELLKGAGVDAVIDIRLNNKSQLAGYSKRDDLRFLLETCFGVRYLHLPDLAPTAELLDANRKGKDWDAYLCGFAELMRQRDAVRKALPTIAAFGRPCLLCGEHEPDKCHRRLVAEMIAGELPGAEVCHLR